LRHPSRIVVARRNYKLLLQLLALWGITSRKRYSIVFARSPIELRSSVS
jgi:hypothetical protein